MFPELALTACLCTVAAMLVLEQRATRHSPALWIPVVWLFVISSRPLSAWTSAPMSDLDSYVDGSPVDRLLYEALIALALVVLWARGVRWRYLAKHNAWLILYFGYCGLSVMWSDYSFVATKRWVKELGNVLMILVVLSERDPVGAVRSLLLRVACLLLPLSVVFVKYFPQLSRGYTAWTGTASFFGIATNKNMLGMSLTVVTLALLHGLVDIRMTRRWLDRRVQRYIGLLLLACAIWLLSIADSATAIVCTALGVVTILLLRLPGVRRRIYVFSAAAIGISLLVFGTEAGESLVQYLGRDLSFTGRTEIWDAVLREETNPFFGSGFYSFWLGDRVDRLSAAYYYVLNEAHNGYIELYLNGGAAALMFFAGAVLQSSMRLLSEVASTKATPLTALQLALLVSGLVYNFSEAVVSRLDPMWFGMLIAMLAYPPRAQLQSSNAINSAAQSDIGTTFASTARNRAMR